MLAQLATAALLSAWTAPGYSPADTYYNPSESVINAGTVNALESRWTAPLATSPSWSCSGPSQPLVSGGRVFVTEATGIAAFQAGTGRLSWRYRWASPEDESTPRLAVAGGLLIAANHGCQSQSDPNGAVLALHVTSGKEAWSAGTSFPVETLVVDKGIAAVSGSSESDTPEVTGLRVTDGTERWTLLNYKSSGVSANGRLMINGAGTRTISITTGKALWSKRVTWNAQAATPAGDRFYVTDPSRALIAVNAATGATAWTAPRKASTQIAADGRRVYRVIPRGIEALNARTARPEWTATFRGNTSQPVRAGGLLYTAVDAGQPLGILHAATGKRASTGHQIGTLNPGPVTVTGGRLYLTRSNAVWAYAP
ncbi:outer membrane protein assembly factor BamB family protein [Actinoplanes friuliensis]|uniref:Pyrrolo-quinoline quinone repeat domain-containing protein n=1 Tax=Actinoplanes friuliensis DSM 7358 TaxID=1246995 RepID=U5WBV8_9ACTN|nr:PQQ-binding-like beta-propeller repeat protein [Actinoplanes friuliensis]AGZ46678.1 hypothetical protein AFR_42120 [Actinoplanes friuliensis DSM 7358]